MTRRDGDEVSQEARMLATAAIERASAVSGEARLTAARALASGPDGGSLSTAEIRAIAATALDQAEQLSALLSRLASLLSGQGDRDEPR